MRILFLQDAALNVTASSDFSGFLFAFLGIFIAVFAIIYLYMSLAFMSMAKKAGKPHPGLAWIPGIGPSIVANRISGMHWWPLLLIIGVFIPIVGFVVGPILGIFFIFWMWKTFEALGKPGWWAILLIIPLVNFIVIGIAAWSKSQQPVVSEVTTKSNKELTSATSKK